MLQLVEFDCVSGSLSRLLPGFSLSFPNFTSNHAHPLEPGLAHRGCCILLQMSVGFGSLENHPASRELVDVAEFMHVFFWPTDS